VTDSTNSERPTCQYVGNEKAGLDSEKEAEGGGVYCTAEATTVIRLATGSLSDVASPLGKPKVCWEHSQWLISDDTEREWERCGDLTTSQHDYGDSNE
jgi:hypothetical protein